MLDTFPCKGAKCLEQRETCWQLTEGWAFLYLGINNHTKEEWYYVVKELSMITKRELKKFKIVSAIVIYHISVCCAYDMTRKDLYEQWHQRIDAKLKHVKLEC